MKKGRVKAILYDTEGMPYIGVEGRNVDVADTLAVYVCNVANPLMPGLEVEVRERREDP